MKIFDIFRNQFVIFIFFVLFILFNFIDYHVSRSLIFIFLLIFIFNDPKKLLIKFFNNAFYISLFIMVFYVNLSLVWSKNFHKDLGFVTMWSSLLIIPFFNEILDNFYKKKLFFLLTPAVFYITIWIFLIRTNLINAEQVLDIYNIIPGWNYIRVSFFLGVMSIILIVYLYNNINLIKRKNKILIIFTIIICSTDIFAIESRMGIIAYIITISIFTLYIMRKKIIMGTLLTFIILSLLFSLTYKYNTIFQKRILQTINSIYRLKNNKDYSTPGGQRIGIWIIAKEIIKKHPIVGAGAGNYRREFEKLYKEKYSYMSKNVLKSGKATLHNEYIQILARFGIIGFILYMNIFYQFIKTSLNNKNGLMAIFFVIYYFIFIFTDIFIERYRTLYLLVIFMPIIAFNVLNEQINSLNKNYLKRKINGNTQRTTKRTCNNEKNV